MSYLVLSRKWRPQKFEDIIGQDHITKVLQNAIKLNRVSHAYLFSGPRGIGKTTTARVLAKALNCIQGPTPSPCLKCTPCQEIAKGVSLDVLEIDGASNRGIDEVRNLRENIKLKPVKARFKIYIIDEVHMLTEPAFNALLKTLEEPPSHVKFIFATTQLHKVPLTILSRCQKFEFKLLMLDTIKNKLIQILESEKIAYTEDAVITIAKIAEGSLRDAESLLDQFICISRDKILNSDLVNQFLGTIATETLINLIQSLINSDEKRALLKLEELISTGKEVAQILRNLIQHFRLLMSIKIFQSQKMFEYISENLFIELKGQANQLSKEELLFILDILIELDDKIRFSLSPRILLELGFLKICNRAKFQILDYESKTVKDEKKGGNELLEEEKIKADGLKNSFNKPRSEKTNLEPQENSKKNVTPSIQEVKEIWPQILESLKKRKMSLAFYLSQAKVIALKNNVLTLEIESDSNFQTEFLEERENKKFLETLISEKLNQKDIRIKCERIKKKPLPKRNKIQEMLRNPKLKKVSYILNAKVLKVITENES